MQNLFANVFLCTGCKTSSSKWKKIFAQCQQLHHETASPVPVRAAPPPDDKQACIEDFFLSSARVPVLLPARSENWDAERFSGSPGSPGLYGHDVIAAAEQHVGQMRTQESGPTGDDDAGHRQLRPTP